VYPCHYYHLPLTKDPYFPSIFSYVNRTIDYGIKSTFWWDCKHLSLSTRLHTFQYYYARSIMRSQYCCDWRHQNPDKFKFEFPASFDFGSRSLLMFGQVTCLVSVHNFKMSEQDQVRSQRAAIIEGLRAGRSQTGIIKTGIGSSGYRRSTRLEINHIWCCG